MLEGGGREDGLLHLHPQPLEKEAVWLWRTWRAGWSSYPGLETWTPASKQGYFYSSFISVLPMVQAQIRPQMFPPPPSTEASLVLSKCIRVLFHKHNTAESFQYCWKRLGDALGRRREERRVWKTSQTVLLLLKKKGRFCGFREDPFMYFQPEEPFCPKIIDSFKLSLYYTMFLTRCEDESKKKGQAGDGEQC